MRSACYNLACMIQSVMSVWKRCCGCEDSHVQNENKDNFHPRTKCKHERSVFIREGNSLHALIIYRQASLSLNIYVSES